MARYLIPLPLVGAGVSIYHLLVENHVVKQAQACLISAPGGCATKWINEFGYMTIPTLALTAFVLCLELLVIASIAPGNSRYGSVDMTSGKQARKQRQAAVARPPVRSTEGRRASPKVLGIAVALIIAVALAVVLAIVFTAAAPGTRR